MAAAEAERRRQHELRTAEVALVLATRQVADLDSLVRTCDLVVGEEVRAYAYRCIRRCAYRHAYRCAYCYAYRHAYRHAYRSAYRHAYRHTYRYAYCHAYRYAYRHAYRLAYRSANCCRWSWSRITGRHRSRVS